MGELPRSMLTKSTKFKEGVTSVRSGRRGIPGSKMLGTEIAGDEPFKDLISKVKKKQRKNKINHIILY